VRIYQFHFFDRRGRRPALDFADCRHDGDAARVAFGQLQQHGSCDGVEVFEDERLVMRLERGGGPAADLPAAIHGADGA
jgi:hypothetical protein